MGGRIPARHSAPGPLATDLGSSAPPLGKRGTGNYLACMSSQFENTHQLVSFLETRRQHISAKALMREFEWSRPTLFRALNAAREAGHNIDNERGLGYRLQPQEKTEKLGGFTPKEMESLAVVWQMLENTQNEWIGQYSELRSALLARLRSMGIAVEQWEGRIHYLPQHRRKTPAGIFRKISHALLHRKVIRFEFQSYGKDTALREVHPQQLILYRNGWSLDALDVSRIGQQGQDDSGIRQFSLDLIENVREVKKEWIEIPHAHLRQELSGGYGLFAGESNAVAIIKFHDIASFYVARETWHTRQQSQKNPDGSITLLIPYIAEHPDELIGDILRWGEMAEVLGPEKLVQQWKGKIRKMWESL